MNDYSKQLEELQETINNQKIEKAKLEERIENLTKEKEKIDNELKEMKIRSSDELEDEISKLDSEIKQELQECQKALGV